MHGEEFSDDSTLTKQIEALDLQIKILRKRRLKLVRQRKYNSKWINGFPSNPNVDALIEVLRLTPGLDRKELTEAFPNLNYGELTNLLTKSVRSRHIIENRGTRANPSWFLIYKEKS